MTAAGTMPKLERAEYLLINKNYIRKKIPQTTIQITHEGEAALKSYWEQLDKIREVTKQWQKTAF